jgi:hypothetical protein
MATCKESPLRQQEETYRTTSYIDSSEEAIEYPDPLSYIACTNRLWHDKERRRRATTKLCSTGTKYFFSADNIHVLGTVLVLEVIEYPSYCTVRYRTVQVKLKRQTGTTEYKYYKKIQIYQNAKNTYQYCVSLYAESVKIGSIFIPKHIRYLGSFLCRNEYLKYQKILHV